MPATCTALGKALLAYSDVSVLRSVLSKNLPRASARSIVVPRVLMEQLAEIRSQGYAYDYEESQAGLFCVAAPVLRDGKSVAAISLARIGSSAQLASDRKHACRAAHQIAEAIAMPR
jgi:DNA-binding IclR family transcriptional regulator